MSLTRQEITEAATEHVIELRRGKRTLSSAFRLKCDSCGQLVDRGLEVGAPCPFYAARGGRCRGHLTANPEHRQP